jgi:hypothetical protein
MSKLEETVIELVRKIYGNVPIIREKTVKKLFPAYPSGRDRFDIVLPTLHMVIDTHAEQHRTLVQFGKEDLETTYSRFIYQRKRDARKEDIVRENDWTYISIWYDELTGDVEEDCNLIKRKVMEDLYATRSSEDN